MGVGLRRSRVRAVSLDQQVPPPLGWLALRQCVLMPFLGLTGRCFGVTSQDLPMTPPDLGAGPPEVDESTRISSRRLRCRSCTRHISHTPTYPTAWLRYRSTARHAAIIVRPTTRRATRVAPLGPTPCHEAPSAHQGGSVSPSMGTTTTSSRISEYTDHASSKGGSSLTKP